MLMCYNALRELWVFGYTEIEQLDVQSEAVHQWKRYCVQQTFSFFLTMVKKEWESYFQFFKAKNREEDGDEGKGIRGKTGE